MTSLVLVLDVGTSSVRGSVYDETGTCLPDSLQVQPYRQHRDGSLPLADVVAASNRVLDECLAALRHRSLADRILGVGLSSFAMSWLGVDRAGEPVTPLFTYANRHGADQAEGLRRHLAAEGLEERTYRISGTPIHTAYAPAQLLGLARADHARLDRVVWWQTVGAFLLAQWMGQVPGPISTSDAGWTGLLDRYRCVWNEELVARLPIAPRSLPPLTDYAQGLSGLAPAWARRWPELQAVPFFPAVGDGAAANIGSGALDSRTLAVTVGTSAAVRVVVTEPDPDRAPDVPLGLWGYRIDRHRHLLGGAITDGGSIVRWLRDFFPTRWDDLNQVAADIGPDGHNLTLLPFLHGERSPGWQDNATLAVQGITPATHPGHLLRAGMEAVAFRLVLIARRLGNQVPPEVPILASGGALDTSALWRQIIADAFNREVRLTTAREATSRGAAILALEALGRARELNEVLPVADVSRPHPDRVALYRAALARHEDFYHRLQGAGGARAG